MPLNADVCSIYHRDFPNGVEGVYNDYEYSSQIEALFRWNQEVIACYYGNGLLSKNQLVSTIIIKKVDDCYVKLSEDESFKVMLETTTLQNKSLLGSYDDLKLTDMEECMVSLLSAGYDTIYSRNGTADKFTIPRLIFSHHRMVLAIIESSNYENYHLIIRDRGGNIFIKTNRRYISRKFKCAHGALNLGWK